MLKSKNKYCCPNKIFLTKQKKHTPPPPPPFTLSGRSLTMLPLHLYVATFKQQMHMEYVSLSWCDIQELAISIMVSCIEDCC